MAHQSTPRYLDAPPALGGNRPNIMFRIVPLLSLPGKNSSTAFITVESI
jgi:hypothetical protein